MTPQYGSKYELWQWVHQQTDGLNSATLAASESLRNFARRIEWLCPADAGNELRDTAWDQIGLPPPSPHAEKWWPPGGPTWDGVARVEGPDNRLGALFVEAKGHAHELTSAGTRATEASRTRIKAGLDDVQNALDVPPGTDWLGRLYQPANRLAWVWFAREHTAHKDHPVEAWLVSVYFNGGSYPWGFKPGGVAGPRSEEEWRPVIDDLHRQMKLPEAPHSFSDRFVEVFLPVLGPPKATSPPPTWQR